MTFRETFYQVKELMESRLHDFGLESADADTMGWTTMLSIEQNTRVTIDVPLALIYSDEFLIAGTLETSTYSRLNGKTVKLKVGNTVVATTTTNINGEYSFTYAPVSTGNHSFQVIFEGTNIHAASQSSVVNRNVDKETSIINLDGINTQHYGDTVIFGGQLLDDDGQYISNASIKYYLNNSLVTTLTTDAQGRFNTSKSVDSFETQNIKFVYDGSDYYTNCEISGQIDVYQLQLELVSDKNILSYSDNESATLTAQLIDTTNNIVNLANETIDFRKIIEEYEYGDDIGSVNINIGDSWVIESNGKVKIGDNSNYVEIDFSNGRINIVENGSSNSFTFNINSFMEGGIISFDNGILSDSNGEIIDLANNYSSIDYTILDTISFSQPFLTMSIAYLNIYEIIGSATTNANGQCSVSYYSQATGNIYIKATTSNIFSNNIHIEDITYYDSANTNTKINNYDNLFVLSGTNASTNLSYDSNQSAYKLTGSGNWYAGIPILNSQLFKHIILEMDIYTEINNWRNGVGFYISDSNNYNLMYYLEGDNKFRTDGNITHNAANFYNNAINCNLRGSWCKLQILLDFENSNADIITTDNNNNILLTTSYSFSNTNFNALNGVDIGLMHITETGVTNSTVYVKNIKIKKL